VLRIPNKKSPGSGLLILAFCSVTEKRVVPDMTLLVSANAVGSVSIDHLGIDGKTASERQFVKIQHA
jgi:hypothetical protein